MLESLEPIIMRNEAQCAPRTEPPYAWRSHEPKQVEEVVPAGDDMQEPNDMETNIL